MGDGFSGQAGLQFWQLYFITTPHRWITLVLVFLDRERFGQRKFAFIAIAAAVVVVCVGVRLTTGTLTCLLAVDYLWNAWHFAAQHHGIYRIYARQSAAAIGGTAGQSTPAGHFVTTLAIEKWSLRLFLLFVIVRVAGATWPYHSLEQALLTLDWLVLAIPLWLMVHDLRQPQRSPGRTLYLASVISLYVSLLAAVHFRQPALVLSLATASALFHATEYLALVAWNVQYRNTALPNQLGMMNYLVPRWGLVLAMFILILGAGGWLLDQHLLRPWLLVNVIVAFLHYAYDGLIWRQKGRV